MTAEARWLWRISFCGGILGRNWGKENSQVIFLKKFSSHLENSQKILKSEILKKILKKFFELILKKVISLLKRDDFEELILKKVISLQKRDDFEKILPNIPPPNADHMAKYNFSKICVTVIACCKFSSKLTFENLDLIFLDNLLVFSHKEAFCRHFELLFCIRRIC